MYNSRFYSLLVMILCLSLSSQLFSASRVLWDVSHEPFGQYDLDGEYSQLAGVLQQNGFTVIQSAEAVTVQGLWDIDILVISVLSNYQSGYTQAEVDRIRSFVEGGGGLIILADNTESRPENIDPVVNAFGLVAALSDDVEDLDTFTEHPITQDLERIYFEMGGEVEIADNGQGIIVGFDDLNIGGIAVDESHGGPVILIGDADAWTDRNINEGSNLQLLENCFDFSDREVLGSIEVEGEDHISYQLPGYYDTYTLTVHNNGAGPLEAGFQVEDGVNWIEVIPPYGIISEESERVFTVNVFAGMGVPMQELNSTLTVVHNDPESEPISFAYTLHVLPEEPVHFNIPEPTGQDQSILVRDVTLDGGELKPGVEIGIFTEGGVCAGGAVFAGEAVGFPARSDDPLTEAVEGFLNGQNMLFRIYFPWTDEEIGAVPDYEQGPSVYRGDGLSVLTLDGRRYVDQTLNFTYRWSIISLNVHPTSYEFADVLRPLIENGRLQMVKDGNGRFWSLALDFSNLNQWDLTEGYEVRVAQPARMVVHGLQLDPQMPIRTELGWSIVSYLPAQPMPLLDAFETISDNLVFAKRDDGAFYVPAWGWDGIRVLHPGKGYKISMTAVDVLIYPPIEEGEELNSLNLVASNPSPSGMDMSLLLLNGKAGERFRIINAENRMFGQGIADSQGRTGIPVWGDDPFSTGVEGLIEGEDFEVQHMVGADWTAANLEWLEGGNVYHTDGLSVAGSIEGRLTPDIFEASCYPNPFNDRFVVKYNGVSEMQTEINIIDLNGRSLAGWEGIGRGEPGLSEVSFQAKDWSAGVIFVQIRQGQHLKTIKAVYLP